VPAIKGCIYINTLSN